MEDISRELEREIDLAKPSPHKTNIQKRILIIDDFGEMRPGGHLKVLVYVFLIISIVGILGTAGFYFLFAKVQGENLGLKGQLVKVNDKAEQLTHDKEILMARLVMAGEKPDLPVRAKKSVKQDAIKPEPLVEKIKKSEPSISEPSISDPSISELSISDPSISVSGPKTVVLPPEAVSQTPVPPKPMVSVERFTVVQGKTHEELIVKFNIRNISTRSKEISGRIFAVLKPDARGESGWVMAPKGIIENSLPGPHRNGQYFSISRFKPVKFIIKNQASPESFKTATVYIFGPKGKLLIENTIQIDRAG